MATVGASPALHFIVFIQPDLLHSGDFWFS